MTKARDLKVDDALWMNVHGRVLAVAPVANGKRVLIKIALEETSSTEFSDGGFVLEVICKPAGSSRSGPAAGAATGATMSRYWAPARGAT